MFTPYALRLAIGLALSAAAIPAIAKDKPDPYVQASGKALDCVQADQRDPIDQCPR